MNNKGFAISGILYGILILFLMVLLSILHALVIRINSLTDIVEEVNSIVEDNGKTTDIAYDNDTQFLTKVRGKYIIKLIKLNDENNTCYAYLPKNILLIINDNKLKYIKPDSRGTINLDDMNNYSDLNLFNNSVSCNNDNITKFEITEIYSSIYNNVDTNE